MLSSWSFINNCLLQRDHLLPVTQHANLLNPRGPRLMFPMVLPWAVSTKWTQNPGSHKHWLVLCPSLLALTSSEMKYTHKPVPYTPWTYGVMNFSFSLFVCFLFEEGKKKVCSPEQPTPSITFFYLTDRNVLRLCHLFEFSLWIFLRMGRFLK